MQSIGTYIDRELRIMTAGEVRSQEAKRVLSEGIVLLWAVDKVAPDSGATILKEVASARPLAMFVCGPAAQQAFETLLAHLASLETQPHIMTRVSEESSDACVEELLQAVWPAEERFDEWRGYVLLADEADLPKLRAAAVAQGITRSPGQGSVRQASRRRFSV